ncbi:MAG: amidohydrolase [Bacteroidales bacterium]
MKQPADFIVWNARIFTADSTLIDANALAVKDGKFVGIGSNEEIKGKFHAEKIIDLQGASLYPGFMDAHCHFKGLGEMMYRWADLRGCRSMEEVVDRLQEFRKTHKAEWLLGRGWDQNLFPGGQFPDNQLLNKAFPDVPVYLVRIDGHAALVSDEALRRAGLERKTQQDGGQMMIAGGKPTGVLIDNAMEPVRSLIPAMSRQELEGSLLTAQEECLRNGLTAVCDAGLDAQVIRVMEEMQREGKLKIRVSAMLDPSEETLHEFLPQGKYFNGRLSVTAIKLYADGALGSRGALLLRPYSDFPQTYGIAVTSPDEIRRICQRALEAGYQVCTHAIGDSANRLVLNIYGEFLKGPNDLRWRIEHAQVVDPDDLSKFGKFSVIPSVQPTHATSDMSWAAARLGDRIRHAYAYQNLLQQNGWMPLGTDFPIEEVNPFLTFHAAVFRTDSEGYPRGGFQPENALSRDQTLWGMTLWAARASFLENEIGSITQGKKADFVVLDTDLRTASREEVLKARILETWIEGECVFKRASND